MMPSVAILAGGLATRLYPVTRTIPKSMIDLSGKPFIIHQLELLKKKGITRIVICAGYLGEQVKDFLKDGTEYGISIDYTFDGDKLLGTGGALKKALPLLGDIFFVMYGDSYLDTDFKVILDYFLPHDKMGLMTVYKNENLWDRSNIIYSDGKILKYDKKDISPEMKYIDYGLGILRKEAFQNITKNEVLDLADLYKELIGRKEMLGYEVRERFYEIGSPDGLKETERYLEKLMEETMIRDYIDTYLSEVVEITKIIDKNIIEKAIKVLKETRDKKGRLFILGVGGGASNASHAVNDFRKIAGIESYTPADNVSELTARVNDDGWDSTFVNWLRGSRLNKDDCIMIFSVGGGNEEKNISVNLVNASKYGKEIGCNIIGIVGRDGGYTAKVSDACVIIPTVNNETVTPHTEAFQAVIWHLLVSHPLIKTNEMKWESVK